MHFKPNSTPRPARTLRKIASTLIFALTLSACASTTPSSVATNPPAQLQPTHVAAYCDNAFPITWSPKDTDETIREVKAHNLVVTTLCKGDSTLSAPKPGVNTSK